MSFNTSLSGLNAATADLSVTSNNIANVGTTGFKGSRAEFADVYAVDAFGTSETAIGSGALLSTVRQQFTQGNLEFTDNSLDMALTGRGFFVTKSAATGGSPAYTRAGAFGVDNSGYIVNSAGQFLQGFPVDTSGNVSSTSLTSSVSLQLPQTFGTPTATSTVTQSMNLPSSAPALVIGSFNPANPATYTNSTSSTVYDSLGNTHVATTYYIKTNAATNTWEQRLYIDGAAATPAAAETLVFNASGQLTTPAAGTVAYNAFALTNGANPLTLTYDYSSGATQYSSAFAVTSVTQNGNTTGRLSSLDISETGLVRANYTNGSTSFVGKVALADFPNTEALKQNGSTSWLETTDSGTVTTGEAGTGRFGSIQGGALESSNVELTEQLVKLITAQRNFQANAKAIETSNAITQTIVQI